MFTGTDIRKLQEIINKLSDTVNNLQSVVDKLDSISTINTGIKQRVPEIFRKKWYLRELGGVKFLGEEAGSEAISITNGTVVDFPGVGDDIGYLIAGTMLLYIHEWSDGYSPDTITVTLKDGAGNVITSFTVDLNNTSGGADATHVFSVTLNSSFTGVLTVEISDDGTGIGPYKIYGDSYIVLPLRRP